MDNPPAWMPTAVPTMFRDKPELETAESFPDGVPTGHLVQPDGPLPVSVPFDWTLLNKAGFRGTVGQTFLIPGPNLVVLVGGGDPVEQDARRIRDAGAAFALALANENELAIDISLVSAPANADAAQAITEGILLSRYAFDSMRSEKAVAVGRIVLVGADDNDVALAGMEKGRLTSEATNLARDLANSPPVLLTAVRMGEIAARYGSQRGLEVEVFDKGQLEELGCGGLLGVNAGSHEPPVMIKLSYTPDGGASAPHIALVGKGIMYDAGGIALKPADDVHATMKNDMSGAGAILAAMLELESLGCQSRVTGYLMCTDNRPSGTALAMGDVITIRGGKTVEVVNTDAEGRLVMADALVLAVEDGVDAIVDVATLTGATMRALGTRIAGVMGNDQQLVDELVDAAKFADEPVWQFPLEPSYRAQLNTPIADIKNLGGPNAGGITAGLFLEEFVEDTPWAHIDIAGTAQSDVGVSWRPAGCTGFGTHLLIEFLLAHGSTS